jgi:hypothetical protein
MSKLDPVKAHPSFGSGTPLRGNVLGGNANIARKGRDETEVADARNYHQTILPPNGKVPSK